MRPRSPRRAPGHVPPQMRCHARTAPAHRLAMRRRRGARPVANDRRTTRQCPGRSAHDPADLVSSRRSGSLHLLQNRSRPVELPQPHREAREVKLRTVHVLELEVEALHDLDSSLEQAGRDLRRGGLDVPDPSDGGREQDRVPGSLGAGESFAGIGECRVDIDRELPVEAPEAQDPGGADVVARLPRRAPRSRARSSSEGRTCTSARARRGRRLAHRPAGTSARSCSRIAAARSLPPGKAVEAGGSEAPLVQRGGIVRREIGRELAQLGRRGGGSTGGRSLGGGVELGGDGRVRALGGERQMPRPLFQVGDAPASAGGRRGASRRALARSRSRRAEDARSGHGSRRARPLLPEGRPRVPGGPARDRRLPQRPARPSAGRAPRPRAARRRSPRAAGRRGRRAARASLREPGARGRAPASCPSGRARARARARRTDFPPSPPACARAPAA